MFFSLYVHLQINFDKWYHVYVVYDSNLIQDNIKLYVLDPVADDSCDIELGTCTPDATANAKGQ